MKDFYFVLQVFNYFPGLIGEAIQFGAGKIYPLVMTFANEINHAQDSDDDHSHDHGICSILGRASSKTGFDATKIKTQHEKS